MIRTSVPLDSRVEGREDVLDTIPWFYRAKLNGPQPKRRFHSELLGVIYQYAVTRCGGDQCDSELPPSEPEAGFQPRSVP